MLPPDAVRNLCTVFALSTIAEPYAGVAQVVDACEPGALAGFWWEAFDRRQKMGFPSSEGWVLRRSARSVTTGRCAGSAPVIRAGRGGRV